MEQSQYGLGLASPRIGLYLVQVIGQPQLQWIVMCMNKNRLNPALQQPYVLMACS